MLQVVTHQNMFKSDENRIRMIDRKLSVEENGDNLADYGLLAEEETIFVFTKVK